MESGIEYVMYAGSVLTSTNVLDKQLTIAEQQEIVAKGI